MIGISFAIAVFPILSRAFAAGEKEKFLENFSSVFRQILFLIIPISVLTFILRAQIVRLVLGTGQFGWLETRLTAASLGFFCLGIFAATLIPFLARVFYSLQDTKTPVVIGLCSVVLNVAFSFFFVWLLSFSNFVQKFVITLLKLEGIKDIGVIGLPLALSISGIFQCFLLLIILGKKIEGINFKEIRHSLEKIILGTFLMGSFTYFTLRLMADFVNMKTFMGVFWQTFAASFIGIIIYILIARFSNSPELKIIKSSIVRQFS